MEMTCLIKSDGITADLGSSELGQLLQQEVWVTKIIYFKKTVVVVPTLNMNAMSGRAREEWAGITLAAKAYQHHFIFRVNRVQNLRVIYLIIVREKHLLLEYDWHKLRLNFSEVMHGVRWEKNSQLWLVVFNQFFSL
jgi:hypothetical protein